MVLQYFNRDMDEVGVTMGCMKGGRQNKKKSPTEENPVEDFDQLNLELGVYHYIHPVLVSHS